ncbi:hypothetical protein CBS101457_004433 [Exobasidium rhododendri]|nr:hypothetical protein CBS101457_004433 [Exobasidium rhododendri]
MASSAVEEDDANDHNDNDDWLESSDDDVNSAAASRFEPKRNDYAMATRDTSKVQSKLFDEGYRVGITTGKEAMIQPGFDTGYNEKGAPVGKKYGVLMGTIGAMEFYLNKNEDATKSLQDVLSLKAEVEGLKMHDMIERDWEALEHEREHGADVSHVKRETAEERHQREVCLDKLQSKANEVMKTILGLQ